MKKEIGPLTTKIFRILESCNEGFFPALAKTDNGVISVFYEEDKEQEKFFELDIQRKRIDFHEQPKCELTEKECKRFVNYLKENGYDIKGETLLNTDYSPGQISLY